MARYNKQSKEPKVKKFRVTLADDNTHRQIGVAKFTKWSFFVTVVSVLLMIFIGISLLIAFTPAKAFIPGYPDADTKKASVQNAIKIDSLENVLARWEFYSENLKRIFEGEDPVKIDSIIRRTSIPRDTLNDAQFRLRDSLLRQTVKDAEQFSVGSQQNRSLPLEGRHFFSPLKGVVSQGYDRVLHPYLDISAPANSVVMSVLDGTVVSAEWSDNFEYTIMVQHSDDIISIYRRNQKLLRKVGDKVTAGTPIALVGSSESEVASDHLHFELWHNGEAVNPTDYISF